MWVHIQADFNKYSPVNVFSLTTCYVLNVFFSETGCNAYNIQNVSIDCLLVRLLLNNRILVLSSGRSQKLHGDFPLHRRLAPSVPHCSRFNCINNNNKRLSNVKGRSTKLKDFCSTTDPLGQADEGFCGHWAQHSALWRA